MEKTQKYWLALFAIIVISVIGYRYYDYVVQRNFLLEVNVTCDPATDTCFVMDCVPAEDPFCDITPYKKVELLASEAPACLEEHACEAFSCGASESCTETFCSDDTREEWEICTDASFTSAPEEAPIETEEVEEVADENATEETPIEESAE